jgi:hypothetical protein
MNAMIESIARMLMEMHNIALSEAMREAEMIAWELSDFHGDLDMPERA